MSNQRLLCVLLALLALVVLQACGPRGVRYGGIAIQDQVQQQIAAGETPVSTPASQAVEVQVARHTGGLALRNGDDIQGDASWVSVEMPAVDLEGEPEEVERVLRPWADDLRARYGTTTIIMVPDYADALAVALEHHLRRRFADASVQVIDAAQDRGDVPLVVGTTARVRDNGIKRFDLVLQTSDGNGVQASGERRPRRHLAWSIPLAVLTFPLGVLIGNSVMPHINRGAFLDAFGEAIDRLAHAYAERLALRGGHTGGALGDGRER